MRKSLILPAALLFAAAAVAGAQQTAKPAQKPAAQPAKPMTQPAAAPAQASGQQAGKPESVQARASYVIGYNLGRTLKHAARARGFGREDANALSRHVALPIIVGASLLKGTRLARRGLPPAHGARFALGPAASFASTLGSTWLIRQVERDRSLAPYARLPDRAALAVLRRGPVRTAVLARRPREPPRARRGPGGARGSASTPWSAAATSAPGRCRRGARPARRGSRRRADAVDHGQRRPRGHRRLGRRAAGGRDDPAARAARWAAAALDRRGARPPRRLRGLPRHRRCPLCHGSPRSDTEILTAASSRRRVDAALAGVREPLVVHGHTHHQYDHGRVAGAGLGRHALRGPPRRVLGDRRGRRDRAAPHGVRPRRRRGRDPGDGLPDAEDLLTESLLDPIPRREALAVFEARLRARTGGGELRCAAPRGRDASITHHGPRTPPCSTGPPGTSGVSPGRARRPGVPPGTIAAWLATAGSSACTSASSPSGHTALRARGRWRAALLTAGRRALSHHTGDARARPLGPGPRRDPPHHVRGGAPRAELRVHRSPLDPRDVTIRSGLASRRSSAPWSISRTC